MTTLTPIEMQHGVWHAILQAPTSDTPELSVTYLGKALDSWSLQAVSGEPDRWTLAVPVPPEAIADGVHTIVISSATDGAVLGRFSLVAGDVLEEDLRAEVSLLRAELDLLKRAFRKHCSE